VQDSIRDIAASDIPTLINWLNGFNQEFDYPGKRPINDEIAALFFSRFIDNASQAALIAERDGKPIATFGFSILPHPWTGAKVLFKAFWYCDKAAPGTGLKLMRYVEELCRAGGVEQIVISSMTEQVCKLLERNGYLPCEINYIKDLNT